MGVSALWSHAKGKKHQARASSLKVRSVDIRYFASNKENSDDCGEPISTTASATAKTASIIIELSKNLHIVDAEIHWCLRMVNCHSSCNSCADLGAMFQVLFSDSEIASQFKLGKTKTRYAMLYGIALNSRSSWYMTLMQLLFILFLLMRASILKCRGVKWMLDCGIGVVERTLLKLTTLTQISCNGLMLTFYSKHGWIDFLTDQGAVSPVSNGWTSGKLKHFEIAWWQTGIWKLEQISEYWKLCTACCSWGFLKTGTKSSEFDTDKILKSKCSGCLKVRLLGAISTWRKAFLESFLSGNNNIYNS